MLNFQLYVCQMVLKCQIHGESVFQLLNSNLGSLTFLYFLLLHYLWYSRLYSSCSIVISSKICDSYLAKFTTTLLGRGSLFPSIIFFSHQSPCPLLSPTNVIFRALPPIFFHAMQSSPTDRQICSKQGLLQGPLWSVIVILFNLYHSII